MKLVADSDTTPLAGGASQNWISLGLMVVVGAIALASLYMGFKEYGDNNLETAFMYILIGVSGFVAIGFSFFRGQPMTKASQAKESAKEVDVVTTLECPQCNLKRVRAFKPGDFIFKKDEPCTRCEGNMIITRINARKEQQKKKD
jgi:hypothetical protein